MHELQTRDTQHQKNSLPVCFYSAVRRRRKTAVHDGPCGPCIKCSETADTRWFHRTSLTSLAFQALQAVSPEASDKSCLCQACNTWARRQVHKWSADLDEDEQPARKPQREKGTISGCDEPVHCSTQLSLEVQDDEKGTGGVCQKHYQAIYREQHPEVHCFLCKRRKPHRGSFHRPLNDTDTDTEGALHDVSSARSFSPFTRLVTAAYYSHHRSAFHTSLPNLHASLCAAAHPHSESAQHSQHISFVNELRKIIWPRTTSEGDCLPSCSALDLHWRRCCWVLRVWQQALCSTMQVPNLTEHGWSMNAAGEVLVEWDTEESISAVKALLDSLTSGCSCKTGCTTKRCKCSKAGQRCSVGCHCHNCKNNQQKRQQSSECTPGTTTPPSTSRHNDNDEHGSSASDNSTDSESSGSDASADDEN